MKVIVLNPHGFCQGVSRAIKLAEEMHKKTHHLGILGPLVHNESVMNDLEKKGIHFYAKEEDFSSLSFIPKEETILFSAHGHDPSIEKELEKRGISYLDGTCPFVALNAKKIDDALKNNLPVIYLGEEGHAECKAALARSPRVLLYGRDPLPKEKNIVVVSQTTLEEEVIQQAIRNLKAKDYRFSLNGLAPCAPTIARRNAILSMPKDVDTFLVLGSEKSKNSRALLSLGLKGYPYRKGYLISSLSQLKAIDFSSTSLLALTSGASTPESFFQECYNYLISLG